MGVEFGTGNQSARKYHLEDAIHIFRALLYYFEELNPRAFYLNTGLNAFGFYPQLFYYLVKQYGEDDDVQVLSYRLASILEARIVEGAAWGMIDKTFGIFLTKVKLGWIERQHIQVESKQQENLLDNLPEHKLRQIQQILLANDDDESGVEEIN